MRRSLWSPPSPTAAAPVPLPDGDASARDFGVFLRLAKLTAPFWRGMSLAALLGFATIGSTVGLMTTSAYVIAKAALHPSIADLHVAIAGVRFFGIARGVFRYLERVVSHDINFRLLARLRVWFFRSLEPLAPARLMLRRSGDLLNRIMADVETLENLYVRVMAPPSVALLVGAAMWAFMSGFAPPLALVLGAGLALVGIGLPLLTRRLGGRVGPQMVRLRSELNADLVDGIQGAAEILAFGQEEKHQERIRSLNRKWGALQERMAWITGLHSALSGLVLRLTTLATLAIAIPLVRGAELDGTVLAVLVMAVISSFEAVLPLPLAFQYLAASLAGGRRLFEMVDTVPAVLDPPAPAPPPLRHQPPRLEVRGLNFRYGPDAQPALDGVSFSLPAGGRLAVVGPSGSGKSTLVNLMLRFWEYQEGHISLDGQELRSCRQEDVRAIMGVVSQQTHLFNATVRENLLLARPDASEDDLLRAARQAHVHSFVQSLPQGYDSWIGEQGLRLSGGERQRLSIARAILKNPSLLVLDEPTANLDATTEREVMHQLHTLMNGRTTLLITHRLVGLEAFDEILVMREGRIVERGRHHQLLEMDGLYRRMWELQTQAFGQ